MLSWAKNSAAYRLSRSMMSERQLAEAIRRKAKQKFTDIVPEQIETLVAAALRFGRDNKALDDRAYAEISTRSAMNGGRSRRAIAQRLSRKGIDRDTALEAIKSTDEVFAAMVYARRRRLGPFRREDKDESLVAKEMAALARQGFSYDVCRKVLGLPIEEAEAMLMAGPEVNE
jgi:regulatory protein